MDAHSLGALVRRKPVQRLIVMIMLLCSMIGLSAASPLFSPSSIARAATSQSDFGSNVYIFNPGMPLSQIQSTVNSVANQQLHRAR